MTTERRPLSGLEWRLLLTTGLAGTYLLAWVALQRQMPAPATPPQDVAAATQARTVAAKVARPAAPRPPRTAGPRPAPAARSRPHRVRTRSS